MRMISEIIFKKKFMNIERQKKKKKNIGKKQLTTNDKHQFTHLNMNLSKITNRTCCILTRLSSRQPNRLLGVKIGVVASGRRRCCERFLEFEKRGVLAKKESKPKSQANDCAIRKRCQEKAKQRRKKIKKKEMVSLG